MNSNPISVLLRWLSCHLVAVGFISFAAIGFYYQDYLFEKVIDSPAQGSEDLSTDQPIQDAVHVDEIEPLEQNMAVQEEIDAEDTISAEALATPKQDLGAKSTPVQPLGDRQPTEVTEPLFRTPEAYEEEKFKNKQLSREQLLQAARRAYWNQESMVALAHYQDYLEKYPDDADVYGELGNLYQTLNIKDEAMNAFFRAGQLLKKQGLMDRLSDVVSLLKAQGDPRAEELEQ